MLTLAIFSYSGVNNMVLKVDYKIGEHNDHLYASSDNYLIDVLEERKVYLNNNCRQGNCGQCVLKLHAGNVLWHKKPLAPLNNDEILACCCKAATDISISN
jgi:ferredoxin